MTRHVAREGETDAVCGKAHFWEPVVSWAEAMDDPDGRSFDCVACLKALRGGQRHARPEGEDV